MVKTPEPQTTERKYPVDDAIQKNAEEAKDARGDNLTQAQRDARAKRQNGEQDDDAEKAPIGTEEQRRYALELAVRTHDASGSQVARAEAYLKFLTGEPGGDVNPQNSQPPAKGF